MMMLSFSAVLFGISVGCLCWILVQRQQSRSLVTHRLSEVQTGLSLPYPLVKEPLLESKKKTSVTLDNSYEDKVSRQLFLAGYRSQPQIKFFRSLIKLGVVLPVILIALYTLKGALTFKGFLLAVALGGVFAFCIPLMIGNLKRKRQKRIARVLPEFLDLLVVCIEAGLNFSAALSRVLQEIDPKEPLTQEFKLMHQEFLNGLPLNQACDRLAQRCEVPDLSVILSAVIQSEQMGSGLAKTLRVQANESRDKYRQRMREKAHQMTIKIIFPAMLIFATIFIIALGPAGYKFLRLMQAQTNFSESQRQQAADTPLHPQ